MSPVDTVQDVRQYLFESAEACDITSYSLHLNGSPINDFVELAKIEKLAAGSTLSMVEGKRFHFCNQFAHYVAAPYNKRSGLMHIRRLREILSFHLFNFSNSPSPSLFSYYSLPDEEEEVAGKEESALPTKAGPQKGKSKKGGDKPFADASTASPPVNPLFQLKADKEEISEVESLSLETFYPNVTSSPPACVKSIEFSGWNPPPGNRNLLGEYLVVLRSRLFLRLLI